MVTKITAEEFDTVVMGIALLCAVMTSETDEQKKMECSGLIMKGLALIKAGVFQ
jgi:hypothetical protein